MSRALCSRGAGQVVLKFCDSSTGADAQYKFSFLPAGREVEVIFFC